MGYDETKQEIYSRWLADQRAALHPAYPIKCRTSTQRTQAPESVDTPKSSCALDPLENTIDVKRRSTIAAVYVAMG
jgi:hypothetical protein